MGKKKKKKKVGKKTLCRAVIPLDTRKIREKYLKNYRTRKKQLEKLESQLDVIREHDEPEYQKFLALNFGAEQTRLRELEQSVMFCEMRIDKIRFLADCLEISPSQLCGRLMRKVTPEHDFWYCLEEALMQWHEDEERREREEQLQEEAERREREARKSRRKNKPQDEWDEQDFDDEFEDMLDSIFGDDDDYDDDEEDYDFDDDDGEYVAFEEKANRFFDGLFGLNDQPEKETDDGQELKKLYRELCMQYHPDRSGIHDARMKRIWNEIQEAYRNGDLDRLRFFRFNADADHEKNALNCSELQNVIDELEDSILCVKADLKSAKYQPYYGFSAQNGAQREQTVKKLRQEFLKRISSGEKYLQKKEMQLDKLIHRGNNGKRRKEKRKPPQDDFETDDLFEDIPF